MIGIESIRMNNLKRKAPVIKKISIAIQLKTTIFDSDEGIIIINFINFFKV